MRNRPLRIAHAAGAFVACLVALGPGSAAAQINDHLTCYRVADPHKFSAVVTMSASKLGMPQDCRLKVRASRLCVPSTKTINELDAAAPAVTQDGTPLVYDRICYKVKCPTPDRRPVEVTDQFGTRTVTVKKVVEICTPAVEGLPVQDPPAACGNSLIEPGEQCEEAADCSSGAICEGCQCSCLIASDPLCPDVLEWTQLAGTGTESTATKEAVGWKGLGHDNDLLEGARFDLDITCTGTGPSSCGLCAITGLNPGSGNCRCAHDPSVSCGEPLTLDASSCTLAEVGCTIDSDCRVCSGTTSLACSTDGDCPSGESCLNGPRSMTCNAGQCVSNCSCYLAPPAPRSIGNAPLCVLSRFDSEPSGTWNVDTGAGDIDLDHTRIVYLGENLTEPCPYCAGDVTPGDGVRDGVCQLGQDEGAACDANASDATFPVPSGGAYSYDCLPGVGKNISGLGVETMIDRTTGSVALAADVECGFSLPGVPTELCPCGACSDNSSTACMSNADCAPPATCGRAGQGQPLPDDCLGGECVDVGSGEGACSAAIAPHRYCDGALRANGEPFVTCLSDLDCDATSCGGPPGSGCGDCSLTRPRACFLDPIEATGAPDPDRPVTVGVGCMGSTGGSGVNAALGLPGPVRVVAEGRTTFRCAGDPAFTYPSCP